MAPRLLATLCNLTRRDTVERDLNEELDAAIDALADEKRQLGVSPDEARRQAVLELGGADQVKERVRDVRAGAIVEGISRDVRVALRVFGRSPGFAAVAVATLALGIGATTTVYGWARRALIEPLPGVPRQSELVMVTRKSPGGDFHFSMPTREFDEYRRHQRSFVGLYGSRLTPVNISDGGDAERLWGGLVTGDFFRVLGIQAARGRLFGPDDGEAAGGSSVVVVSDALWRSRFAADPALVGRTVTLNGAPHTVIGVTPAGFVGGEPGIVQSFWLPLTETGPVSRGLQPDETYGRLRPGVSLQQATADLAPVADQVERASGRPVRRTVALFRLWQSPIGSAEILLPLIAILGAVVTLVLVLTCANVSNLLLTHAAGRQREMAVRVALGAARWRLVRQFGIESLMLATAGGIGGIAMAYTTSGLLLAFIPPIGMPIGLALGLDWASIGFASGATLLTAVVVGVFPALNAARSSVTPLLNAESVWASGGRRRAFLRDALVVAQVALSMVLLVGAGLFLRSLANAGSMKPGFDPQNVLVATIDLEPSGYKRADGLALFARLLDRVKATPGAEAVTLASRVPLSTFNRSSTTITVDGYSPREGERMDVSLDAVGPDYFRTLRIPILSGRDLSADDLDGRPLVAIVNDAMAGRFWPGGDALGRTFVRGRRRYTVVGVASNVKSYSVNESARPGIYVPALQEYWSTLFLMARTKGDPGAMSSALRSAVQSVDRGLPVVGLQPMTEHVRFAFFVQRVGGTVLGAVGGVALLLAALGLYAVVSYSAWRRVREFGVRMALGAAPRDVVRLVVRQGVRLFAIGAPIGLAGAVGLGAAARSQLYGVSATDPLTFAAATTLLAAVLLAGAGLPAWRASRLNVVQALRNE